MDILFNVLSWIADCIAFAIGFAILMFGVCGILFALGSLLHDLMDCEDEEE